MFEKIRKHVLKYQLKLYHKLGDYCFRKVDEYSPKHNEFWGGLTAYFTRKEFDIIDKLFTEETYI